jgi:hypothetical protein
MKKFLIILILSVPCLAHAQITTTSVTLGGTTVTGISSDLNDTLSKNKLATPYMVWLMNQKKQTTTIYKDSTIQGMGGTGDPLRVNLNAIFQRRTLAQVRAVKPPVGQLVYLPDNKLFVFYDGATLRYINTTAFK